MAHVLVFPDEKKQLKMVLKPQENWEGESSPGPRRSITANCYIHFSVTLLCLLPGWTAAVPGPQLLVLAGASSGRVNVKLVLLVTPSPVFSSCLAKRLRGVKFSPLSLFFLR